MHYDNYHSDHRVRAGRRGAWYDELLPGMKATVTLEDEDGEEVTHTVPIKFEVCPTCDGKGTHTNPSIDCNGLSRDDLYEDPDFAEDYFSGRYDVPCYECGGERVVAECADEAVLAKLQKKWEEDAYFDRIQEAERRMGA